MVCSAWGPRWPPAPSQNITMATVAKFTKSRQLTFAELARRNANRSSNVASAPHRSATALPAAPAAPATDSSTVSAALDVSGGGAHDVVVMLSPLASPAAPPTQPAALVPQTSAQTTTGGTDSAAVAVVEGAGVARGRTEAVAAADRAPAPATAALTPDAAAAGHCVGSRLLRQVFLTELEKFGEVSIAHPHACMQPRIT